MIPGGCSFFNWNVSLLFKIVIRFTNEWPGFATYSGYRQNRGWVQNRLDLAEALQALKWVMETWPDSISFVNALSVVTDPVARETLSQAVVSKILPGSSIYYDYRDQPLLHHFGLQNVKLVTNLVSWTLDIDNVEAALKQLEDKVKKRGKVLNLAEIARMQQLTRCLERLRP